MWACAFSPDGGRIVSSSGDNTLKLWDAQTRNELATLTGHTDWVDACAISPDGHRIVSGSHDHTLKIWDAETGAELATLVGHSEGVLACAFSPDGGCIVSASWDKTIKLWDVQTGVQLATLAGHTDGVRACAFSPDGSRIASASRDKTLKLWDAKTGVQIWGYELGGDGNATAWSPRGFDLAAGDSVGRLLILRLRNFSFGPPIVTAREYNPNSSLSSQKEKKGPHIGCPLCRAWSEVPASALGAVIPCPHCGGNLKLNLFTINAVACVGTFESISLFLLYFMDLIGGGRSNLSNEEDRGARLGRLGRKEKSMGIKDLFRGGKKPEKPGTGQVLVPKDKAERMNALFAIGCSIQKGSFRAAGRFLAARHGSDTPISARVLYFDADQVFQDARQLAKEIGDKKKEAEILYYWALLQWHPPEKGISFMSGSATEKLEKMMNLARSGANKPEGDNESLKDAPYEGSPDLALQFFLEALALAGQTGHDLVAAASLLYTAQIYKARGDAAKYFAQIEKLREKAMRLSDAQTPLPLWLLNEIKAEVEP